MKTIEYESGQPKISQSARPRQDRDTNPDRWDPDTSGPILASRDRNFQLGLRHIHQTSTEKTQKNSNSGDAELELGTKIRRQHQQTQRQTRTAQTEQSRYSRGLAQSKDYS